MALILNIETSTRVCSVALSQKDTLIDKTESKEGQNHAELLTVFIDELMQKNHYKYSDLDAIAYSSGPGSYTGLRIGLSVAKGLCFGLNIPLIAVPTLLSIANAALKIEEIPQHPARLICPLMDARRMEVYTALYQTDLTEIKPAEAKIIDANSFSEELKQHQVLFLGDGADKCQTEITSPNALFINDYHISADSMIELSYQAFVKEQFEDVAYCVPFYLKEYQAVKSTKKYF